MYGQFATGPEGEVRKLARSQQGTHGLALTSSGDMLTPTVAASCLPAWGG